jgi:lipopolysaccharide export system protein LptC
MARAPFRTGRFIEQATMYLPTILMAILALGTYWLVRSTPQPGAADPSRPPTHNADYFMRHFSLKTFDAGGRLKTELLGKEMRHFPDTDTLEIDGVTLRTFDDAGRLTVATADRGLSNGDGSEVQLMGNAVVVREAGRTLGGLVDPKMEVTSDFLHVIADTERLKTHKPVVIQRGQDRFSGDSLDYDNLNRTGDLRGRVKGVMTPTGAAVR